MCVTSVPAVPPVGSPVRAREGIPDVVAPVWNCEVQLCRQFGLNRFERIRQLSGSLLIRSRMIHIRTFGLSVVRMGA